MPVGLPNGEEAFVGKDGRVVLAVDLILEHVLVVPTYITFQFNIGVSDD